MDRKFAYAGQIPLSAQFLESERNAIVGIGVLAQTVFGSSTLVDGLVCTPTSPASLTVQVGPGSIYQFTNLDSVAFGALGTDVVDNIVKQGINLSASQFTLTPPGTVGTAINYLIQAQLSEIDTGNTVLPYVNSTNPSSPFTGPGNSGTSQPTTRKAIVALSVKSGIAAPAGTQATPAPDAGYTSLQVVTVAYGATTLSSGNIAQSPAAPFLFQKLPQMPTWVQSGAWAWGVDTGTANAIVANLTPLPLQYTAGMHVIVKKISLSNTAAMTVNFNGLGNAAVVDADGNPLASGSVPGNYAMLLCYDGTSFRILNSSSTTAVGSLSAASGELITVSGGGTVGWNLPGGTTENTLAGSDLFGFYSQADGHHRVTNLTNLTSILKGGMTRTVYVTSTATLIVAANETRCVVKAWGPGGSGGGAGTTGGGGGGGGGEYREGMVTGLTGGQSILATIGVAGAAGAAGGSNAAVGTATTFGGYATANAGGPGFGSASAQGLPGAGGSGGASPSGGIGFAGTSGENAFYIPGGQMIGIGGQAWGSGHAHFGAIANGFAQTGASGVYPGQGADGGLFGADGGVGAKGMIIVEFYTS